MLAFAIRRLVEALAVILAVALIAFILFRFVGDPVNQMVAQDASLEDRLRLRQDLGLDDPVLLQFARFAAHDCS
jgi:peptide/nickel transport system permease protein